MTTPGMNIVHHDHPPTELDAPAWDAERLLAHLAEMHDLPGMNGRNLVALAAIHAAEHPEDWG
jgi:hypothetical protein